MPLRDLQLRFIDDFITANDDGLSTESFTQHESAVIRTTSESTDAVRLQVLGTGSADLGRILAGTLTGVVSVDVGGSISDNTTADGAGGENVVAAAAAFRSSSGIGHGGGAADDIDKDELEALKRSVGDT